jgi:hypothetical protein
MMPKAACEPALRDGRVLNWSENLAFAPERSSFSDFVSVIGSPYVLAPKTGQTIHINYESV